MDGILAKKMITRASASLWKEIDIMTEGMHDNRAPRRKEDEQEDVDHPVGKLKTDS